MNINWFFISSSTLTITFLFLIGILLKFGKERFHFILLLFNISLFIWAVGATLISTISSNTFLSICIWRLASLGVSFSAVFGLHMIYLLIKEKGTGIILFSYSLMLFFNILILKTNLIISMPLKLYHGLFFRETMGPLYLPWFLCWLVIIIYDHYLLFKFYLTKQNEKPSHLIYFIIALLLAASLGALNFLLPLDLSISQYGNFGIVFYCIMVTYLILKHQILGIEVVFKKGLFYSIFIGALTGFYLLLIMLIEWLFRGIVGYKSLIISFTAAFSIALLFNPLRNKIQSFIDHIFLGKTPHEIADENELLRQELERSDRLKATSTLALGLAHEIKNPLTTLKTFSEYLPQKFEDKAFLEKFAKLIPEEVERINSIVHQLLDFSKPSPPSFKDVPIHDLVHNILELLSNDFLKKKIIINESFDPSTQTTATSKGLCSGFRPPSGKQGTADLPTGLHNINLLIKADHAQLKQALLNIFLNAMEAMPQGGNLLIKTSLRENNSLEIQISDDGGGISKKDLSHIFDPFYSTKESGTGLGLSISHQIIKNHKGFIDVESELGKGTTFRIRLPREL